MWPTMSFSCAVEQEDPNAFEPDHLTRKLDRAAQQRVDDFRGWIC